MRGNWIGLAIGLLFVVGLAAAPIASAADTCDNTTLRELNYSTELSDCRAYEMVSSAYKQGFNLSPQGFTDEGIFAYQSMGSFAGNGWGSLTNKYVAVRTPSVWETRPLFSPMYANDIGDAGLASDMRSSAQMLDPRDGSGEGAGLYIRDFDGGLARVGQGPVPGSGSLPYPRPRLVSDDLSHVVYQWDTETGAAVLWEYAGVGSAAVARQVNVDNNGGLEPDACPQEISGDGRVIIFGSPCGAPQIRARVGGSATVAVSGSECTRTASDPGGVCNGFSGAVFEGASGDGSRVFFTTDQQLVNDDRDLTTDLYACDIPDGAPAPVGDVNPCETLTEVSGARDGAGVTRVAAVSEDGSRVYFVAQGVLADNLGTSGVEAVEGDQNLYLWTRDAEHPAGLTRFVAGLDSSGVVRADLATGGRYLVFSTAASLVSGGPGADTDDGGVDVYRYDERSETVLRLSTSVTGSGGNTTGFDATFDAGEPTVSADGSMVVFNTAEALSPADTDGVGDVYLWREGRVSRISRGGGRALGISSTGDDIYFITDQRLTAADGDVNTDIYDARVDGGFDLTRPGSCSGDACRGQQSVAPDLARRSAGEPGDDGAAGVVPAISLRAVSATQRKRLAATGRLRLVVSVNTAGVVAVKATAKIGRKLSTVASGHRTIAGPGTATVALTLSKKARKQLAARGGLAVRIVVSRSGAARRSVTLRLVHVKAKGGRS